MSLTHEALNRLISLATAAAAPELPTDTAARLVHKDYMIESLEHLKDHRRRFRGHLDTHSIADFSKYVKAHTSKQATAGFVDQDNMACTVIFNLGNAALPGHGDHTATLKLKPTAAFIGLLDALGRMHNQRSLAEWLEDWVQHLTAYSDGSASETLGMAAAITGIRRMTIKATTQRDSSVGDFSATRSAMDEIEAKSQDVLPTAFDFITVPYEGLQPTTIRLRLSVITGRDEEPMLRLRWVGEEAQREDIARKFKGVIEQELGEEVPLTIGTFTVGK